jgi:hypothetical protein
MVKCLSAREQGYQRSREDHNPSFFSLYVIGFIGKVIARIKCVEEKSFEDSSLSSTSPFLIDSLQTHTPTWL